MNQSWFCLGFLSQNSLSKLSTFHGYKGIFSSVREECEKLVFCKIGHSSNLVLWLVPVACSSHEIINWPDCHFCPVVLQLSWPFNFLRALHMWHFGELPVTSHSQDPVMRILQCTHTWISSHSHTQPLHYSHLNTGYLIAKLQTNLG